MPIKYIPPTTTNKVPTPAPQEAGGSTIGSLIKALPGVAARVAGPWAGALAGGALGTLVAPGPGTIAGAIGGGALGGGLSELLAEKALDPGPAHDVNMGRVGVSALIGAVPGSVAFRSGKPLYSALTGAGIGAANMVGNKVADGESIGHAADPRNWSGGDLLAPAIGGAVGGGLGYLTKAVTPKVADSVDNLMDQVTNKPITGGHSDVGTLGYVQRPDGATIMEPANVPAGMPRVIKKGGAMHWEGGPNGVDPAPGKVAEAQSTVRAKTMSKEAPISDVDKGIRLAQDESKANRSINELYRKADNKLLNKEQNADLQNTRSNMGGTELGAIKKGEAAAQEKASKLLKTEADEAIAKKRIADIMSDPDMKASEPVVTEAGSISVPGGKQTIRQSFRKVPPVEEGGEGGNGPSGGGNGPAPKVFSANQPPNRAFVERNLYRSLKLATQHGNLLNADNVVQVPGGYRVIFKTPEVQAPTLATPQPALGPAAQKFQDKVDKVLSKFPPEAPPEPPIAPDGLPIEAAPAPKTPSGGGTSSVPSEMAPGLEKDRIATKRFTSKASANAVAKEVGGTVHQNGPRNYSIKFADAEQFEPVPVAPPAPRPDYYENVTDAAQATSENSTAKAKPMAEEPTLTPDERLKKDLGGLTLEEYRRMRDVQPVMGWRRTKAEEAEYIALMRKQKGLPPPEAPKVVPEISDYTGGQPAESIEVPVPTGKAAKDIAEKRLVNQGAPMGVTERRYQELMQKYGGRNGVKEPSAPPAQPPTPEAEPAIPGLESVLNTERPMPKVAEAPFSLERQASKVKPVQPTMVEAPTTAGAGENAAARARERSGMLPNETFDQTYARRQAEGMDKPWTPEQNAKFHEDMREVARRPVNIPPPEPAATTILRQKAEAQGAAPIRVFKSKLEAAGANYGAIKEAKAAGEKVPEAGRAIAGKAAAAERLAAEGPKPSARSIVANATATEAAKPSNAARVQALRDQAERLVADAKASADKALRDAGGPTSDELAKMSPEARDAATKADVQRWANQKNQAGAAPIAPAAKPTEPGTKASVKFMVTNADKAKLRELGYTPADYNKMTPAQASEVLAKGEAKAAKVAPTPQVAEKTLDDIAKMSPEDQSKALYDEVARWKSEKGEVPLMLLSRIGSAGAGAAVGASQTPDDPMKGAILGGTAGLFAPTAIRAAIHMISQNPGTSNEVMDQAATKIKDTVSTFFKVLPDYQRFALLAHNVNLPMNMWVGPYGSAMMASIEHAVQGDTRGLTALKLLLSPGKKNFMARWKGSVEEASSRIYSAEERTEGQLGQAGPKWFKKLTSYPATGMTAGDVAARDVLMEAGFTAEEARKITLTSEPYSPLGRALAALKKGAQTEGGKKSWAMNMLMPFYRTGTNQFEQGMERVPVVGFLWNQLAKDKPSAIPAQIAQQGMGAVVGFSSYQLGTMVPESNAKYVMKFLNNFGGQYGVVASSAFMMGQAAKKGTSKMGALTQQLIQRDFPMPTTQPLIQAANNARALAGDSTKKFSMPSMVPGIVKPGEPLSIPDTIGYLMETANGGTPQNPPTRLPRPQRAQRARR